MPFSVYHNEKRIMVATAVEDSLQCDLINSHMDLNRSPHTATLLAKSEVFIIQATTHRTRHR